jgi:D-alanine-D-alanine ligase
MRDYGRIGVLMGGPSSEREISLQSGGQVMEALKGLGLDAVRIDIKSADPRENARLLRSAGIGCAFISLHGSYGEDGGVQGLLEELHIRYTGSDPAASRRALDKVEAREVFLRNGLDVPRAFTVRKGDEASGLKEAELFGLPLVVKPPTQGSSIGLSIIDTFDAMESALREAFAYGETVLVEQYIKGRELTVGILEGKALPVIEIVPKNRFFDYEAKYGEGTEYVVPAPVTPETALRAQRDALTAHRSLGCAGCSRSDFIFDEASGRMYVLEVNTIPGLTSHSLLPKAARTAGIEFPQLCLKLLESAYEKE